MTKVEQGILINSQHLYNILNDIPEEISFKDQILALGYKDIEEFFEEKTIFDMQQILKDGILTTVEMPNLLDILADYILNSKNGIVSIYTNQLCVCHGENNHKYLNIKYCNQNNIPIYSYNSFGGNIVASPEDYGMVFLVPSSLDISEALILEKVATILLKYFDDVSIEGNDILINHKKVIGSGSSIVHNTFLMLFYFSMDDKGELINNICGDPDTGKTPGYIDPQILPLQILKEELLSWLQGL